MIKLNTSMALNAYSENKLENLKNIKTTEDAALKAQTDEFESLMVKIVLDTALKLDDPLYPKSAGDEIYQSMYKETLSKNLAGNFGYSELLYKFLKEQR